MRVLLHILTIGISVASLYGQDKIPREKLRRIDSFLQKYQGDRPGYALGLVDQGELIYSKGFGMANLEYGIPISDTTAFYIGSMAKQFTCAALLILESEGKLDFTQSIAHYLPDFPSYERNITVSQLIHHTSGIRETNSLQLFQGIDSKFEEVFSNEELYELIKSQRGLNFKPGTEFRYSSGGYIILTKIIEKLSGESLRSFLEKHVFGPLGMRNTLVCNDHNEIVPNRATSYWPIGDNKYERRVQVFDAYGDGGIITTVRDLAKWDQAFYNDILGVKDFAKKMYQKGRLENGKEIDYALALNVWKYKGQSIVQHNGGMLGFRVDLLRIPDSKTSIILLGNSAFLNPTWDALHIVDIIFTDVFKKGIERDPPNKKTLPNTYAPHPVSKAREGYYWTDEVNYYRRISLHKDSLFIDSGNIDERKYLQPISNNAYVLSESDGKTRYYFKQQSEANETLYIAYENVTRKFRKFDATPPKSLESLTKYVGTYKSQELNTDYSFFIENDRFFLRIESNPKIQLFPAPRNGKIVWNGEKMVWIGYGEIKFQIRPNGIVDGFVIGDQRVSGVYFTKSSQ